MIHEKEKPDLRSLARQRADEHRQALKEKIRKETRLAGKRTLSNFDLYFGDWHEPTLEDPYTVSVQGLRLRRVSHEQNPQFQLWGECAECGEPGWSDSFKDLVRLGELLFHFSRSDSHVCYEEDIK